MICGDSCFNIFVCCDKDFLEDKTSGLNRRGREIVLDRQTIKIEHFHLEKLKQIECLSSEEGGSESDSGVGSVRTATEGEKSKKSNKSHKSPEPQFIDRDSTICTVTRADSMATLDQDCNSLDAFDDDDILSIFTAHIGSESLSDLMIAEFSKMETINATQLAKDFAKHDAQFGATEKQTDGSSLQRKSSVFIPVMLMKKGISKKNSIKSQILTLAESTPDIPSTPEIDLKNREKKMRKKRRMTRKTTFDADDVETDSTSDSSRDSPQNGRKSFQKKNWTLSTIKKLNVKRQLSIFFYTFHRKNL